MGDDPLSQQQAGTQGASTHRKHMNHPCRISGNTAENRQAADVPLGAEGGRGDAGKTQSSRR